MSWKSRFRILAPVSVFSPHRSRLPHPSRGVYPCTLRPSPRFIPSPSPLRRVALQPDAINGRSFEDIVVEFDPSYRPDKPFKVFGGQHRVTAIGEALKAKRNEQHGVRIYLGLTTEQRLEIAKANNTAIAVANDLLDRMQEEFLGAELRN